MEPSSLAGSTHLEEALFSVLCCSISQSRAAVPSCRWRTSARAASSLCMMTTTHESQSSDALLPSSFCHQCIVRGPAICLQLLLKATVHT